MHDESVRRSAPHDMAPRELRKRAQADGISLVAVELALELGCDRVTVEMICERALISHRTFYNYFPSREAALIGHGPTLPSAARIERFCDDPSRDVVGDLLTLLAEQVMESDEDTALSDSRRRLFVQEPGLVSRGMASFADFLDELTSLTLKRLERMGRTLEVTPDLREEASMIVTLATSVMQRAFQILLAAGPGADTAMVLHQSIALARRVLDEGRNSLPSPANEFPPAGSAGTSELNEGKK